MNGGRVHLVGAGPGDPGLLTVRAVELLRRADAVVYDRLVHPGTLAHARPGARLFFVGKEGGGEQVAQEEIHRLLIAQARLGREVVRLKGGDQFVFGRGGEEAFALAAAGIPFDVVPGVSSGLAAPALAGIPVTQRGVAASVTFATATLADGPPDWAHLAAAPTLVLFMVGRRVTEAAEALQAAGRAGATPAALVQGASRSDERVVRGRLADIGALALRHGIGARRGATAPPPVLLVVGDVAALEMPLAAVARGATGEAGAGAAEGAR